MADHTMKSTPTMQRGHVKEVRRCTACNGLFDRPQGSEKTHRQVDDTVACPEDAGVTTIERANRWTRR